MLKTIFLAFWVALSFADPSQAQDTPKPLGIPLGAPLTAVQSVLSGSELKDVGVNKFSGGPMVETDGAGLDVEGLKKVFMIFDKNEKLLYLQMTLRKSDFDRVYEHMKKLYRVKSQSIPFVGDKLVVFTTKEAHIELEAPHMSFESTATYMTSAFYNSVTKVLAEETKKKKEKESSRF